MTLTELKYIIAVAREKNFNRAAEKCFVSQPTLSIAIKKLEEQLNIIIFERGNQITVTETGLRIVEQAQRVLEEAEKIKLIANEGRDQLKETLKIGAIHTVGPYLFPQLISHINELAPNMPLIIEENFTKGLTEKLYDGELDIAIIALPYQHTGIDTLPLYQEPFEIIIPKTHEWKNKKTIEPDDFRDQKVLMLGEGNCFRDHVLSACPACALPQKANSAVEKMLEGSSLETIRYMVSTGIGISVMPHLANQRHQDNTVIIKAFAKPIPYREIALAYRSSFPRPDAVKLMASAIRACELDNVEWSN